MHIRLRVSALIDEGDMALDLGVGGKKPDLPSAQLGHLLIHQLGIIIGNLTGLPHPFPTGHTRP